MKYRKYSDHQEILDRSHTTVPRITYHALCLMFMTHKKLTIGLALGAGAARGIAHIGILQRLETAGIPIDYIAGSSTGALIGALYASGVSSQELQEFALNITWSDLIAPHPTLKSLVSGKRLVKLLQKHIRIDRFEDLQIPLAVIVSDFETGQSVPITEGELFPAILASCSIPLLFPPVYLKGRKYIDGGFAAMIPVETVREMGVDIVIACDVHYNAQQIGKAGRHFFSILFRLMMLVLRNNARESKNRADLAIHVNASGIGLTHLSKGKELIQRGIQATEAILPELQKLRVKKTKEKLN